MRTDVILIHVNYNRSISLSPGQSGLTETGRIIEGVADEVRTIVLDPIMELEPLFIGGDLPRNTNEWWATWTGDGGVAGQPTTVTAMDDRNSDEGEAERKDSIHVRHHSREATQVELV